MNTFSSNQPDLQQAVFFLSDIIGAKVFFRGKKIGKLNDIAIIEQEKIPEVTYLVIKRPFGYKTLLVPWEKVTEFGGAGIGIDVDSIEAFEEEPSESQVLLRDHILDKKVIDMDDNEIDVVYDIKLVMRGGKIYVTDVDFSRYGFLKRIGLKPLANLIYSLAEIFRKETLSWAYVQHLPESISSFRGNIKLKILKDKLPEIHPVDLADILEELDERQRLAIFSELDTEHASDTLEEIEPRVQRSLIASLDKERVADLIDEMTPAQAADVLSILPSEEADQILDLMEHEETDKIESLLEEQDDTIANLATVQFISFRPEAAVDEAIAEYRRIAPEKDVVTYVYIVGEEDRLLGVVAVQELLMAGAGDRLEGIMTTQIIRLHPEDKIKEAAASFARYGFRALPVTNEDDFIVGVVLYRDIMNLEHKFA
ncbi:MAG: CBS domain-containing protein [Geobacteraceae bacterium]|nr:CBS domain-containing protein [Geobacteraceae bacterium]